ncbi:MFS general substrate transporter [Mycena sanguinolenta]|uniref:MFS general substrate transporter n=1 Tax=Mycena sanguinolenta TaxID=230812 RepID=A0A8H6YI91_9AGAR|nr:MFS general substrate transporter [Mycena sanguinolenta]
MATERTPLIPKGPADASRRDFALLMTGIWSLVFIGSLDATIVATLISTIGSSMESMQFSSWIGTAYLLSLCRLANILGRRPSMLFAGTLFGGGTILCGFAQNIWQLVAFRAIAGMGGSGMTVVGSVILSDSVPLKTRGLYQGFTNLLFGLGGAIGGPLGGWLGDTIGWRAAFLYQSPFLACSLVLLYLKIREPELVLAAAGTGIFAKLKRIDYAGSASLVFALLAFLLGMHFKSTAGYDWDDSRVWALLTAAAVLACVFVLVEFRFAAEPIMPIAILKRRTPGFVALNNFLIAVLSFSTLYNTPLYFTAARLRTSANAGAHLIPNSVFVAIGSLLAGWYMRKTGRYWNFQAIASLGLLVANLILASWNPDTPEWVLYITLAPSGFAFASVLTTTLLALIASVPRDDIPLATGISYLFRTMGQVLGVSLSATLTQTLLARNLRARIADEDTVAKILDSTAYIHTLPADLQVKATTSWALALRTVFYCQIVRFFFFLPLIFPFFLRPRLFGADQVQGLAVSIFLSLLPMEECSLPDTIAADPVKRTAPVARDAERAE